MDGQQRPEVDWDPRSEAVTRDQRAAYDEMRERCPVAYSEFMQWSIFRHADVMRVLLDHDTFRNAVSEHVSVPNGMDPPQHTIYRRLIDRYFTPDRMALFEPCCRAIASELVGDALGKPRLECMSDLALPYAVRLQCAFLDWPEALHGRLVAWTHANHAATLAQDRPAMAAIAQEFESLIGELLAAGGGGIMAELAGERVGDRALNLPEIASILRNWTVGEIGTISASVGILIHYLAEHPDIQSRLRGEPGLLTAANDEILRIHGPLVANRRLTSRSVEIGGRRIGAGERITIHWMSANRDPRVFPEPDEFRLDRDSSKNLLYGAGIHVCPGAPLARLELRVLMEELLGRTEGIAVIAGQPAENAIYPASGYSVLPVKMG
ncbi:MAG TPA: cytochrome P450 [Verrucomicrobia bacterium]|jgi:hypothetical protein|nr:cytochrome P450 [Verrucomicrobiota bacterium]